MLGVGEGGAQTADAEAACDARLRAVTRTFWLPLRQHELWRRDISQMLNVLGENNKKIPHAFDLIILFTGYLAKSPARSYQRYLPF